MSVSFFSELKEGSVLVVDSKLRKTIIKKGYINSLNFNPKVFKKLYFDLYEKIYRKY